MKKLLLCLSIGTCSCLCSFSQSPWPAASNTARPWTRWWWMGSAVNEKNITALLGEYKKAGIGGVEIVPIYGAKGYESTYLPYLSPQWMRMLDTTVQVSRRLGMGVDVSVGTGWPIGGPQVTLPEAATKLHVQKYTLEAGHQLPDKILINDVKQKGLNGVGLATLMAYSNTGETKELTGNVLPDGTLQWTPANGSWQLIALFTAKTLQKVKRAAPGGEGYSFDHFSATALTNYFKTFDNAYGKTSHGVRSFFNDSYEVFNANWAPDFFAEFSKRRGYDLKNYLRELLNGDNTDLAARIKSDYRETMADLMLDNFSAKFSQWSHNKQAKTTNQAHGSPGNLLDLYAAVDIAETESFGASHFEIPGLRRDTADIRGAEAGPMLYRFAASAAHVSGHPLASSESLTWLTEHFKTSWSQCKPELEQLFLSGINHVFFHGTTYSPVTAAWPGWLFYASVNFVPANSLWPHLQGMTGYIARCQSVLQAGQPDNEVLLYWPVYDQWHNAKGMDMPFRVHNFDQWLGRTDCYKTAKQLQDSGCLFDFVSDKMIQQATVSDQQVGISPDGPRYKTIVIPFCKKMPVATFQKLIALAEAGATIVFQQLPEDVPGYHALDERRQELKDLIATFTIKQQNTTVRVIQRGKGSILISSNAVKAVSEVAGRHDRSLAGTGLQFIRRKDKGRYYYFIVNHTANTIDSFIALQRNSLHNHIMDPLTGEYGIASTKYTPQGYAARIQLKPGESIILKITPQKTSSPAWKYTQPAGVPIVIKGPWKLDFTIGGPSLPADRSLPTLQPWTALHDTTADNFSGSAVYSTTFTLNKKSAGDYLLQLGKVYESARVWINGKEVGILWSIPFEARAGKYLRTGRNTISIEITNLMANRIRYMDRNKISWRNYHEINFVNIGYKDFDASGWSVSASGLQGPVVLLPLK